MGVVRPLPVETSRRRTLPSARACHVPDSFRPCRSSRLRRFTPHIVLQVCCALQPAMGFAKFLVRTSRDSGARPAAGCGVSPPRSGQRATTLSGRQAAVPSPGHHPPRAGPLGREWLLRVATLSPSAASRPSPSIVLGGRVSAAPRSPALRVAAPGRTTLQTSRPAASTPGPGASPLPSPSCGALRPSELFPTPAAAPRHRDPCPPAVGPQAVHRPSARCRASGRSPGLLSSTSGPCSTGESVAPRGVATTHCSLLPWACVVFQDGSSTAPVRRSRTTRRDPKAATGTAAARLNRQAPLPTSSTPSVLETDSVTSADARHTRPGEPGLGVGRHGAVATAECPAPQTMPEALEERRPRPTRHTRMSRRLRASSTHHPAGAGLDAAEHRGERHGNPKVPDAREAPPHRGEATDRSRQRGRRRPAEPEGSLSGSSPDPEAGDAVLALRPRANRHHLAW